MLKVLTRLRDLWRTRGRRAEGPFATMTQAIAAHGWTGIYVGDYTSAPTWTYTVGFTGTLERPEVIIFDLPQDAANALLCEVFAQLKDGRLTLEDGKAWPERGTLPSVWRSVHPSQIESDAGWFTFAMVQSFARTGAPFQFEAFQLVLSDNEGRLPWDEGYDERLRPLQPALWLPVEEAPSPLAVGDGL